MVPLRIQWQRLCSTARAARRSYRRGFTLLELLIVIAILGLLMAIATPQLMRVLGGAKHDAARLSIDALGQSLDLYKLDVGSYPTTEQGLNALWTRPEGVAGWFGPYVKSQDQLKDPYGRPFNYVSPGKTAPYAIFSYGEDGQPGGEGESQDIGLVE